MRSHEVVILVNQSTKDAKDAMFPLLHFVFSLSTCAVLSHHNYELFANTLCERVQQL